MKRTIVLAALAALVIASSAVAAPRPHHESGSNPGTMELNLGYAKSNEDIGNGDTMAGGLAFGAAYWLHPSPAVSWGPEVSFDNMGSANYDNGLTTGKESMHLIRVHPTIRYTFTHNPGTQFYGQAGAGLYSITTKVDDSGFGTLSFSDSKFGFNMGAGVEFPAGPTTKLSLTGIYHIVPAPEVNNVKVMNNANYLQFRAGIGFNL